MEKICGTCKVPKLLSEFNRKKSGHNSQCRSCQKAYWSSYYASPEKKQRHIANSRKNANKDRAITIQMVNEAKSKPCADCGHKYPYYVMDFDHLPGTEKVDGISVMRANGRSRKLILEEIAKCDVVCANCHRERTHQRRQEFGGVVQREDTRFAPER